MLSALSTSRGKIPDSKVLYLGTRAASGTHPFEKMLLPGGADYRQVHAADPDDNPFSIKSWRKANPGLNHLPDLLAVIRKEASLKDLGQTYRNTSVDRSALDRLMELTSGVRVSAHVPVPATNRQNVVIRRGMSMTAVAPVWEGITIIPDEVTQAKKGQLVITAVMLYAMKVLRTGAGLVKQGTDHS